MQWVPEATDVTQFDPRRPLADRPIDILEFGRHYDPFHARIRSYASQRGLRHLYERTKGEIVFRTRPEFVSGLATSKISVCFPQSLTHPERFGHIETVTSRYFESMASGCIILGRCPDELRTVFDYDPVIEADLSCPEEQLEAILGRIEEYQPLVDRNLQTVQRIGTWYARVATIESSLHAAGYSLPAGRMAAAPA